LRKRFKLIFFGIRYLDCWGDGEKDWWIASGISSDCKALQHSVLLNCWPAKHWPNVSILINVVH